MKLHEPKMILNLSIEDEELQKKIETAMEAYIEKISLDQLENKVAKFINKKVDALLTEQKYGYCRKELINGKTIEQFISEKVENKISEVIDNNIKEIMAKKLAQLI